MLDQDDEMHPRKFEAHLGYARDHPDVEITYNPRYDLLCSGRGVWQMYHPPANITLADFVLGFPISPSETVLTRKLMQRTWSVDDVPYHGGEILWYGRLVMDGVRFGFIDEALNYRRYHPGRRYSDIAEFRDDYIRAQDGVFNDPRCPEDVRSLRPVAHAWSNLVWCCHAYAQGDLELGRQMLRNALTLDPKLTAGSPAELTRYFANFSVTDDTRDHEPLLRTIFGSLPEEAQHIAAQLDWAINQGFLVDGLLAIIWGRPSEGKEKFAKALERGARIDDAFLLEASHHLHHFQADAGDQAADEAVRSITAELRPFGAASALKKMDGALHFGRALRDYRSGDYRKVPRNVVGAIAGDPAYSLNRGAWAILMRSLVKRSA